MVRSVVNREFPQNNAPHRLRTAWNRFIIAFSYHTRCEIKNWSENCTCNLRLKSHSLIALFLFSEQTRKYYEWFHQIRHLSAVGFIPLPRRQPNVWLNSGEFTKTPLRRIQPGQWVSSKAAFAADAVCDSHHSYEKWQLFIRKHSKYINKNNHLRSHRRWRTTVRGCSFRNPAGVALCRCASCRSCTPRMLPERHRCRRCFPQAFEVRQSESKCQISSFR